MGISNEARGLGEYRRHRGKALKKLVVPTFDGGEYFGLGFGKVRKILFEEDLNLVAMDPHAGWLEGFGLLRFVP